ncbi:MAG: hypothetical protein OHK0053_37400 [Microscillaceae bacterium]
MKKVLSFPSYAWLFWAGWGLGACDGQLDKIGEFKPYEGPTSKVFDMVTNYSDSGRVKIQLLAPLQLEYESGNQDFPEGITVNFFNAEGQNYNRLTAKKAIYDKKNNQYTALGEVVVNNLLTKETLQTEELHWRPTQRQIFTEKFVVIQTPREILKGNGLTADQDFMAYKIKQPTGKFSLPEN